MKKAFNITIGLILLASISFASSITVTKPHNGNTWAKNAPHVIEWRTTGEIHAQVKIRLFNGNGTTKIKDITNDTPTNVGRFSCQANFFNDVPSGTYTIRVRTLDNNVTGVSAPFFIGVAPTIDITIEEAGNNQGTGSSSFPRITPQNTNIPGLNTRTIALPSSIKINYPKRETNWRLKLGNTALPFPIRVQWEKTGPGTQDNRVKIILFRKISDRYMRRKIILTPSTRNTGLFTGRISRALRSSMYTIIIQTLDGKIRVESEMFQITNAENDPH